MLVFLYFFWLNHTKKKWALDNVYITFKYFLRERCSSDDNIWWYFWIISQHYLIMLFFALQVSPFYQVQNYLNIIQANEVQAFFNFVKSYIQSFKVHIFWEGHTILRNHHHRFVLCSNRPSQNIWTSSPKMDTTAQKLKKNNSVRYRHPVNKF